MTTAANRAQAVPNLPNWWCHFDFPAPPPPMEPKHWLRKTESRAVASVSEAHRTAPHTHLQKPEPENFCSGTTDKEASRKRDVAWSFEMSRQINQRAPDLSWPSSHRRCQHQRQFGCEKCAPQRNVSETIKRGAVL